MEKQNIIKNVFSVFSSLLGTKTPKCMQSTLFGVTKRHSQKRVIWVFFLSILGIKTLKKLGKHPIWQNKITLSKTCVLSVFKLHTYQNAKMRAKKSWMEKQNNITKNFECIWSCYVTICQNVCKLPYLGKRNNFNRNGCNECFSNP